LLPACADGTTEHRKKSVFRASKQIDETCQRQQFQPPQNPPSPKSRRGEGGVNRSCILLSSRRSPARSTHLPRTFYHFKNEKTRRSGANASCNANHARTQTHTHTQFSSLPGPHVCGRCGANTSMRPSTPVKRHCNKTVFRQEAKTCRTKTTRTATLTRYEVYSGGSTVIQDTSGRDRRPTQDQTNKKSSAASRRKHCSQALFKTFEANHNARFALYPPPHVVYAFLSSCGGSSRLQVGHSILMSIHRVRHPW